MVHMHINNIDQSGADSVDADLSYGKVALLRESVVVWGILGSSSCRAGQMAASAVKDKSRRISECTVVQNVVFSFTTVALSGENCIMNTQTNQQHLI